MEIEVKKIDQQGRVALPSKWRKKALKGTDEVVIFEKGDHLVVRPRIKRNITEYFDGFEADVDPKLFRDYNVLKRVLLGGKA